ncbi:MAG: clostripain-related cysteine peptidase [Eubacteriales bacterium]
MKKILCLSISIGLSLLLLTGCLFLLSPDNNKSVTDSSHTSADAEQTDSPEDAAGASSATTGTAPEAQWTVLLYMCGTDLESENGAATNNLLELQDVKYDDSVNFIIQTGGTNTWKNDLVDPGYLQRFKSDADGLTLLDQKKLASMGDPSTLSDFLKWGIKSYPAEKYMVLFWNHGGGSLAGVEFDEVFDSDSLTLPELGEAFKEVGQQFEIIGFDTCLMSTLENASTLSEYGNYMVASEEYEPGGGWAYAGWTQYLMDHPGANGKMVGKQICDTYYSKCEYSGDDDMATLAVVDLKKIPVLVTAFDAMATEMTGITNEITTLQDYVRGAIRAENFGGNTDEEGYTNMVDLGDLTINTQDVVSKTAEDVLNALFDAVVYDVHGTTRAQANGLSVFFPLAVTKEECDSYAEIATSGNYLRFIEVVVSDWSVSDAGTDINPAISVPAQSGDSVTADEYTVDFNTYISDDGYYYLEFLNGFDSIQSVMFNFYYMDYDYGEYMLMGTDNDLISDWDNGVFYDNFRGVWPALNGYYVDFNLIEEGVDYNLYSIPITLNGVDTNLRAAYVWDTEDTGHFEVYGCWTGLDSESGMSSREIVQLKDGDEVTILMNGQNWDTGETIQYGVGTFVVDGPVVLEEMDLFDGDYLFEYMVTDVFGSTYYSDSIIMEYKDGQITEYTTQ